MFVVKETQKELIALFPDIDYVAILKRMFF